MDRDISHIFLVPDEGAGEIVALHERLYSGMLAPHLRSDIPFVPHMTIGSAADFDVAQTLADELHVLSRPVCGTVAQVELVNVGTQRVQSIARYGLGTSAVMLARDVE